MTNQEIFDTVVAHLRKQGVQSKLPGSNTCAYRSPEGLKCAAGCLIPDEDYKEEFECWSVRSGVRPGQDEQNPSRVYFIKKFGVENISLIQQLQEIHDSAIGPHYWEDKLEELARSYKLIMPPKETPSV